MKPRVYDAIIVGGGHAGVEAAIALAKSNFQTLLISLDFKMLGHMPCNPAIGGSAKGIVVREVDALGGMQGVFADYNPLQMKILNTKKGPGVQCLRSQSDRQMYKKITQRTVKNTANLHYLNGNVVNLLHENKSITGVVLEDGMKIMASVVILTTGTYLDSEITRGQERTKEGPDGVDGSYGLADNLKKMGIPMIRLKTGTPPRILQSSIDFSKTKIELGTPGKLAFSYRTKKFLPFKNQSPCHLIYTTAETHDIILNNLDKSALYGGNIHGIGPRYCPSIESKVVQFKDKDRHQLFLEPEDRDGKVIYLQGFSSSMDRETQERMVHSLPGLENAVILKYAYAIEYEAIIPTSLNASLMSKQYNGLFVAGQMCGTSGYEEAAGLGLMAALNAVRYLKKEEPFILRRDESYIGVMIDDLVTKGITEPYRLLSSRAEYRLLLRHDNADLRLMEYGRMFNLIDDETYNAFVNRKKVLEEILVILDQNYLSLTPENNRILKRRKVQPLSASVKALEFLKRPDVSFKDVQAICEPLKEYKLDELTTMQLEVKVKYEGYIQKQIRDAENLKRLEQMKIPTNIDYNQLSGLALEARDRLSAIRPMSVGQASRISGINPSDISYLVMYLKKGTENGNN